MVYNGCEWVGYFIIGVEWVRLLMNDKEWPIMILKLNIRKRLFTGTIPVNNSAYLETAL